MKKVMKGTMDLDRIEARNRSGLTKCAVSTSIWNCVVEAVLRSVLSTYERKRVRSLVM